MPAPISFSVAPKARQGTFSSNIVTNPGGYTTIYWEIILTQATDYQNPANQITTQLLVNGVGDGPTWQGNALYTSNDPNGYRIAVDYDISQVPVGSTVQVSVTLNNRMTAGIQNGLVS